MRRAVASVAAAFALAALLSGAAWAATSTVGVEVETFASSSAKARVVSDARAYGGKAKALSAQGTSVYKGVSSGKISRVSLRARRGAGTCVGGHVELLYRHRNADGTWTALRPLGKRSLGTSYGWTAWTGLAVPAGTNSLIFRQSCAASVVLDYSDYTHEVAPPPPPPPPNTKPEIINLAPAPGSTTADPAQKVTAVVRDGVNGVGEDELGKGNVRLFVNGLATDQFVYDASNDLLTYAPLSPFSDGAHRVAIEAADNRGLANRVEWQFTVASPPQQPNRFVTGISEGYRDYPGVERFYGELGGSDGYSGEQRAHEFVDHRYGWNTIANGVHTPAYDGDPTWIKWVAENDPNRRLIVSLPLLPTSECPEFVEDTPDPPQCLDKFERLADAPDDRYDQYFRRFAQGLDTGPDKQPAEDAIVRLGWEFNGQGFPWRVNGGNVEDYKRAWNRVVGVMKQEAPELEFEWAPNVTLDKAGLTFDRMYPGDQNVDYVGLGMYDYKFWGSAPPPGEAGFEARWSWLQNGDVNQGAAGEEECKKPDVRCNGMIDHAAFAKAHGKPMAYTEYGLWEEGNSGGGGNDPSFIRAMAKWFGENPVAYHVYNNPPNGDHKHNLDNPEYEGSKRAYLEEFGR